MKNVLLIFLILISTLSFSQEVIERKVFVYGNIVENTIEVKGYQLQTNCDSIYKATVDNYCVEKIVADSSKMSFEFGFNDEERNISFVLRVDKIDLSKDKDVYLENIPFVVNCGGEVHTYVGEVEISSRLLRKEEINFDTFFFEVSYRDELNRNIFWFMNF